MTPFPLGRRTEHDRRSLNYPATAAPTLRTVTWRRYGPTLDQMRSNSCTGHAMAHAINSRPLHPLRARILNHGDALALYSRATELDQWPGSWDHRTGAGQDEGSSGLAVAKAAREAGHISGYRWCFGIDHVLGALTLGPVLIGTDWTENMFTPTTAGLVEDDGPSYGGHEYLAVGIDLRTRTVLCQNSWGPSWGLRGRFRIGWDTLDRLLRRQGDALQPSR